VLHKRRDRDPSGRNQAGENIVGERKTMLRQRLVPLSSMASSSSHEFVRSWLSSAIVETHFPPTPPRSNVPPRPSKRKRANSMPPATTSGRASPKRRRTEQEEDVSPAQSASQIGRSNPFDLTDRTTLSAVTSQSGISSPKRTASPTREASIKLRTGIPAIAVNPISGLREKPPELVRRLRDTLSNGFETGFIPACLEVCIYQLRFATVHSG
jgi:hypothetical protein